MEYEDDKVLNFKKKTPNKKKKKKPKQKTFEEIAKERQSKRAQEEQMKLEQEAKTKENKSKKANETKENERSAMDFELDLLGREFSDVSIGKETLSSSTETKDTKLATTDEEVVDVRVSEYDFM